MTFTSAQTIRKNYGFTLIELLVVIAIIGVLAAIVLAAINPVEQLARSRDVARKADIAQMGKALLVNATNNNSTYLPSGATWLASLKTAGDVSNNNSLDILFPNTTATTATTQTGATVSCTENVGKDGAGLNAGYCYIVNSAGTDFILYTPLEAKLATGQCLAANTYPVFAFVGSLGSAGGLCAASTTAAGVTTITAYGTSFTTPTSFAFH